MSSTARSARHATVIFRLLALIALLAMVGHFVADAVCLGAEIPGAASFGTGRTSRAFDSLSASCSWHASFALALVLAVTAPMLLTIRKRATRPYALFVFAPLPLLPPITTQIA